MLATRPIPANSLYPDIVFIDLEASGLHPTSFPIEVGIANDRLETQSWLIRPHHEWRLTDWSFESERVHGITWGDLQTGGTDIDVVCAALNSVLAGKLVVSDAPDFDGRWLWRLFAVSRHVPAFQLNDVASAYARWATKTFKVVDDAAEAIFQDLNAKAEALAETLWPHTHRAGDDALAMAATFRLVSDPAFMTAVEAVAGPDSRPSSTQFTFDWTGSGRANAN